MPNYYQILNIAESASQDEIKKAYRTLAKKYHPDLNPSEDAQEKFIEIEEAYTCLSKARSRRIYDDLLRGNFRQTASSRTSQKRESSYQKQRKRARAQAKYHTKMSYSQYRRDEKYRLSFGAMVLKFFLNAATFVLLFLLLIFSFDFLSQYGIVPDHSFFGIIVFLSISVFILSVIVLSFVYDHLLKKWILRKSKSSKR